MVRLEIRISFKGSKPIATQQKVILESALQSNQYVSINSSLLCSRELLRVHFLIDSVVQREQLIVGPQRRSSHLLSATEGERFVVFREAPVFTRP